MATLEKIRKRSGLLIIIVGLALVVFILTDLLSSGNSLLRGDAINVGKINREAIDVMTFNALVDERIEIYKVQSGDFSLQNASRKDFADVIWDELIREKVWGSHMQKLGIIVTAEELYQRVKSDPNIQQAPVFKDQVTGLFSDALFQNYIQQIQDNQNNDQESRDRWKQWLNFEKAIREQSAQQKYIKAVEMAIYIPKAFGKMELYNNNQYFNVELAAKTFESIPDSVVEVKDSDIRTWYNKNKREFRLEEPIRSILYASFAVNPSSEDEEKIRQELISFTLPTERVNPDGSVENIESFIEAEDDSTFVAMRSDVPFNREYIRESKLENQDTIFRGKEAGYIYGPYLVDNEYRLTKVSKVKFLPDSVNARHILLSFQGAEGSQSNRQPMEAKEMADTLLAYLKANRNQFDSIARALSDDKGSAFDGGNLNWFGPDRMVKPFSEFCFTNKKGDIGLVLSEFGFHIIEILDQKGAERSLQLATIVRELLPSEKTIEEIYSKASRLAAAANDPIRFEQEAVALGTVIRPVTDITPMQEFLVGLGRNRDIVRWAFNEDRKVGDVDINTSEGKSYVVVKLTQIENGKYRSLESVKNQVKERVLKEKKAQIALGELTNAAKGASDLKTVADRLNLGVTNARINFTSNIIPGIGNDPKAVGFVCGLPAGLHLNPFAGDLAAMVVQIKSIEPVSDDGNYENYTKGLENAVKPFVRTQIFESLKKSANIVDQRYRFF
ncbi:MAG: peptidylprolyl isomerase [Thermaurantimonas sp.]